MRNGRIGRRRYKRRWFNILEQSGESLAINDQLVIESFPRRSLETRLRLRNDAVPSIEMA